MRGRDQELIDWPLKETSLAMSSSESEVSGGAASDDVFAGWATGCTEQFAHVAFF